MGSEDNLYVFLYQYKNQGKGNTLKKKLQKPIKVKQNPIE